MAAFEVVAFLKLDKRGSHVRGIHVDVRPGDLTKLRQLIGREKSEELAVRILID